MKSIPGSYILKFVFLLFVVSCGTQNGDTRQDNDWLVNAKDNHSQLVESPGGKEIILTNGLIERTFRITPNFATVGIKNLVTGQNYVRSVRPEARVTLSGQTYDVGGLLGQPVHNYILAGWKDILTSNQESFQYVGHSVGDIKPRFDWKIRKEWLSRDVQWPPKGKELTVEFRAPEVLTGEAPREVLYSDNFTRLDEGWKIHASPSTNVTPSRTKASPAKSWPGKMWPCMPNVISRQEPQPSKP
jgi:hypothetical protein